MILYDDKMIYCKD